MKSMQTTIRVVENVVKILEHVKKEENLKSYNDVIKKLAERREISMFGVDKKLKKWKEPEDRAKFR